MTPSDGAGRSADPELLLRDQRWLVALARSLVGDEQAAEDVVQEARIAAWLHAPGDPSRAGGWLRRVVRNLSIRVRRSDARRLAREQAAAPREATPATDELVARVQMQRAVAEAVLALDEPYRSAILLRFFDRLPPRDIAARLGAPVETVRTRLKRALEQLRVKLDRDFGARDAWAALLLPWTTVATATTKVGLKVAVAAVLIGSAGVATWQSMRRTPAPSDAPTIADAAGATANDRARDGGRPEVDASGSATHSAARSEDAIARDRPKGPGFDQVHLSARIVDESTHAPIAGAKFTVKYWLAPGRPEASATSDRDGRVVVDFGPAESDNVSYVVEHVEHACVEGYLTDDAAHATDGRVRRFERDLGELALERGFTISGHVVRLPDRTTVAQANLFCLRKGWGDGFWPATSEEAGLSRSDGSFDLPERFGTTRDHPIVFAITPTGVAWGMPAVVKGRERIDDLEIAIDSTARLDATVVDENGAPLPDASVVALPRFAPFGPSLHETRLSMPTLGAADWCAIFSATTDRAGAASLPFLPEGRDDPELARQRGHVNARAYVAFARASTSRRTAVADVGLERGKTTSVKLVARPLVPLTIRGRVADERGGPVADAKVELENGASATSDEAGLYELAPFTADVDRLAFKVSAPGLGGIEQQLFDSKLGDRIVPIRDAEGVVRREELTVDFAMSSALSIAGRCIDAAGNGVARVGIEVQRYDGSHSTWVRSGSATDEDGNFRIGDLTPGVCSLGVSPPDGFRGVSSREVPAGTQGLTIRLVAQEKGCARVVAEVVDATTKLPAEVVSASLFPVYYGNIGISCSCSVGSVVGEGLGTGRWRLTIRTADGAQSHHYFDVTESDREIALRIEAGCSASIEGHVTLADGAPIEPDRRLMVLLRAATNYMDDCGHSLDRDGRISTAVTGSCARVDPDGSFRMADVTPGIAIRVAVWDSVLGGETTVVLEPGEKRHVEIEAVPGVELSFRVAETLTPGRIWLEVARSDDRFGLLTQENAVHADGMLLKTRFSPGRLRWRATHVCEEDLTPRPSVVEGELEVVAGHPQVVDIRGLK